MSNSNAESTPSLSCSQDPISSELNNEPESVSTASRVLIALTLLGAGVIGGRSCQYESASSSANQAIMKGDLEKLTKKVEGIDGLMDMRWKRYMEFEKATEAYIAAEKASKDQKVEAEGETKSVNPVSKPVVPGIAPLGSDPGLAPTFGVD